MPRRRFPYRDHFTDTEFLTLCEQYDWRCVCCGQRSQPLEPHQVIPRNHGGTSTIYNMQLCPDCKTKDAIDYRIQWSQTRETLSDPLDHEDFNYGLIADPQQRLLLYQRTGSIKRLLEEIGCDWEIVSQDWALELPEEVYEAWRKHELWPAILGCRNGRGGRRIPDYW